MLANTHSTKALIALFLPYNSAIEFTTSPDIVNIKEQISNLLVAFSNKVQINNIVDKIGMLPPYRIPYLNCSKLFYSNKYFYALKGTEPVYRLDMERKKTGSLTEEKLPVEICQSVCIPYKGTC
ncbi:MAG: hypothetical protein QWI36_04460 [Wolbachia endosymbiont of Tyrophagus putrescentiae]|nr:hypothetical protein [Wolbachia endosymbiont of Tyrophagus putrescentiae]